jgi:hypothetical protein
VLARSIREAYHDLFTINKQAHNMTAADVKNKMKTLSEGQFTDRVLTQMAGTFTALVKLADFSLEAEGGAAPERKEALVEDDQEPINVVSHPRDAPRIGGLVYSINLQLPESRDLAVYDALFKSLKAHLLS